MPRSLKKGPFVDEHLLRKVVVQNEAGTKNVIKTWSRRFMIIPAMLGQSSQRRQEAQVGVREDASQSQEGPLRRRAPASQG
ncbi:hypothetical protein CTI14_20460, partial [Methylobacterium radiotolerans]